MGSPRFTQVRRRRRSPTSRLNQNDSHSRDAKGEPVTFTLGCGTRKRLPTTLLSLRWNEKSYKGDDQGGMLRSILHKESSGWNGPGLEVDHYGSSQKIGCRVWLWNEKLAFITFYNEAFDARAKLSRNVSNH